LAFETSGADMIGFWNASACSLVEAYRRFRQLVLTAAMSTSETSENLFQATLPNITVDGIFTLAAVRA
jgi:hypothetical protein